MADRAANEDVVNARVAAAKARLADLAAQADARPGLMDRAALRLRSRPMLGVGAALLAGLVLGVARKRALPAVVPLLVPALRRVARGNLGLGGLGRGGPPS